MAAKAYYLFFIDKNITRGMTYYFFWFWRCYFVCWLLTADDDELEKKLFNPFTKLFFISLFIKFFYDPFFNSINFLINNLLQQILIFFNRNFIRLKILKQVFNVENYYFEGFNKSSILKYFLFQDSVTTKKRWFISKKKVKSIRLTKSYNNYKKTKTNKHFNHK